MATFKKGDVLWARDRRPHAGRHPIVFIAGPEFAPLAVVLTHTSNEQEPCNVKLSGDYDLSNTEETKHQFFIGHLIEKMQEWGPYEKCSKLTREDLNLVEQVIVNLTPITWAQYKELKKQGCSVHPSAS